MSRYKPALKTYAWRQPANWWTLNPFLFRYMVREWSSLLIVLYALTLLWGLYDLTQGEAAWGGWLAAMASPAAVLFNLLALLVVTYHSYTWFKVTPKTMPDLPIESRTITLAGWAAVVVVSALTLLIVYGVAR